jgi:hypothetical protein
MTMRTVATPSTDPITGPTTQLLLSVCVLSFVDGVIVGATAAAVIVDAPVACLDLSAATLAEDSGQVSNPPLSSQNSIHT